MPCARLCQSLSSSCKGTTGGCGSHAITRVSRRAAAKAVTKREPSPQERADLEFAWKVCKHVKSNAIVVAKDGMLLGAGAGQMDRPSAARLAIDVERATA